MSELNKLLLDECGKSMPSLSEVRRLLHDGADVNASDPWGMTSLVLVIRGADTHIAKELLNQGAHPDVLDIDGRSPLHWAAAEGRKELASVLVNLGVNVNAVDTSGRTSLHLAVCFKRHDILPLLLDLGCLLDQEDNDGFTPLHMAATYNAAECAVVLMKRGASQGTLNQHGQTPLMVAAATDEKVSLAMIAHGADASRLNQVGLKGLTALHAAARGGLTQRLLELIDAGADPHVRHRGKNAFDEAVDADQRHTLAALQAWLAGRAIEAVMQVVEQTKKAPTP